MTVIAAPNFRFWVRLGGSPVQIVATVVQNAVRILWGRNTPEQEAPPILEAALEPRVTLWARLAIALGCEGLGPRALADTASARVAAGRGCPGRPGVMTYPSVLAASVDHELYLLEVACASADSRLRTAEIDADGIYRERGSLDALRREVGDLRRRELKARDLAPLGQRYELEAERLDAERELAKLSPTPERARVKYAPPTTTSVRAFLTPNDAPRASDVIAKANLRDVACANAVDQSTDYSRARDVLTSVESRILRWESEFPALAAALAAEVAR